MRIKNSTNLKRAAANADLMFFAWLNNQAKWMDVLKTMRELERVNREVEQDEKR